MGSLVWPLCQIAAVREDALEDADQGRPTGSAQPSGTVNTTDLRRGGCLHFIG